MNKWLALSVSAIYAYVAFDHLVAGRYAMAIAYGGWAAANTALIFATTWS